MIVPKVVTSACLALLAVAAGSSMASRSGTTLLAGRLAVDRSGDRMAFVLVDRRGIRKQVEIPPTVLASNNGIAALEGRWLVIDARADGRFPVASSLAIIPADGRSRIHDPILLDRIADAKTLKMNQPRYAGPVTNLYEAVRAGRVASNGIQSVLKNSSVELGGKTLAARIYLDGDARHYLLVSPASLFYPGRAGVWVDDVREDRVTPLNDGSGAVLSHDVQRISNPFGGDLWFRGQTYRSPEGPVVEIHDTTAQAATVTIRPFGFKPAAVNGPDVVTNTTDSGAGSLRNAITYLNANPNAATSITFQIPSSDPALVNGVFVINPQGALPVVTVDGLSILGSSQTTFGGDTNPNGPEIDIHGPPQPVIALNGLEINAQNVTVDHLAIGSFLGRGLQVDKNGVTVQGCFFGTHPAGYESDPNGTGIFLNGASNAVIGGSAAAANLISGNNDQGLIVSNCDNVHVQSNSIGTGADGSTPLPNQQNGMYCSGATNLVIGGTGALRNTISGNTKDGIYADDCTGVTIQNNTVGISIYGYSVAPNGNNGMELLGCDQVALTGNIVSGNTAAGIKIGTSGVDSQAWMHFKLMGNTIGTDEVGTTPIGNATGIDAGGILTLTVGDGTVAGRNLISGNQEGIALGTTLLAKVQGNYIGTNRKGSVAIPNRTGLLLEKTTGQTIVGGTSAGQGNLISGNYYAGIVFLGTGNQVIGNQIGTNALATNSIPNLNGVILEGTGKLGSSAAGGGNVICGNAEDGVQLLYATQASVVNNFIGVLPNGRALPNGNNGVHLLGPCTGDIIGGLSANEGNVISGNGFAGIFIDGILLNSGISVPKPRGVLSIPSANTVIGNVIGMNKEGTVAVPNQVGVWMRQGVNHNVIGGSTQGAGNNISGNSTFGVFISDPGTYYNTVQGNLVSNNGGNGVTIGGGAMLNQVGTTKANTISGNMGFGVRLSGANTSQNLVEQNVIQNNTGGQIRIDTGASSNTLVHNAISTSVGPAAIALLTSTSIGNNVRGNTFDVGNRLLVDLVGNDGPFGVTPNDSKDVDTGPNNLQNNANINTASLLAGKVTLTGTLPAKPSSTFSVDVYAVDVANSAGHGGRVRMIATLSVTTNSAGTGTFSKTVTVTGHPIGLCTHVTAANGDTSEFGANKLF